MKTRVVAITDADALPIALAALQTGQVVVVPTDTVYGLVCRFDDSDAIERIYVAKGRPVRKALPVLLGEQAQLGQVVREPLPATANSLMARFWPGPLTLVLPAQAHLPSNLTAGGTTVAVRVPDHDLLREIARRAGPLASTSANRSAEPAATTAGDVLAQLAGTIPLVLDGGRTALGMASTVVDLSGVPPRILREGPLATQIQPYLAHGP